MVSPDAPILNPVLRLTIDKRPTPPGGGGKSREQIINQKLNKHRKSLPKQLNAIKKNLSPEHSQGGQILLFAKMGEERLAPSMTPSDLFDKRRTSSQLVTSTKNGFLVEAKVDEFDSLINNIQLDTIAVKVDVTSVESLSLFSLSNKFNPQNIQDLWNDAAPFTDHARVYKLFTVWLLPYQEQRAKQELSLKFKKTVLPVAYNHKYSPHKGCWESSNIFPSSIKQCENDISKYLKGSSSKLTLPISSIEDLNHVISSGTICRIEPITQIQKTNLSPVASPQKPPIPPLTSSTPIVAVVDGCEDIDYYASAITWKADAPFIPRTHSNKIHANQVASLVVDATGWNPNLDIPNAPCRIAPIQVVPNTTDFPFEEEALLEYLDELMEQHPETKVWNFSFNQIKECHPELVSTLGHGLHQLARKHSILPIISAGNTEESQLRIAPPADCEAALVVGSRKHDRNGKLEEAYDYSRQGLGPCQTMSPEISWYSNLCSLGGNMLMGTSYSAPLISRQAAYLFAKLKNPSPDAVRALLIHNTERKTYDRQLGWGSPSTQHNLWACSSSEATMVWTSTLETGQEYHWDDIAIPPSMIHEGKIYGEIILTTILNPLVVEDNSIGNYFLSRVESTIQTETPNNRYKSLSSFPQCDIKPSKWDPIRHVKRHFTGKACPKGTVRLRSRVYLRDRYKINSTLQDGRPGINAEVTYALTFRSTDKDPKISEKTYNDFCNVMRNKIENATVEVEAETEISS